MTQCELIQLMHLFQINEWFMLSKEIPPRMNASSLNTCVTVILSRGKKGLVSSWWRNNVWLFIPTWAVQMRHSHVGLIHRDMYTGRPYIRLYTTCLCTWVVHFIWNRHQYTTRINVKCIHFNILVSINIDSNKSLRS